MFKEFLKNKIGPFYTKLNYPIVVNSYGRSGSTVLTKSIVKCAITDQYKTVNNITYRSVCQPAWNLSKVNIKDGIVYKTHDYPPENEISNNVRMLYTFADPADIVFSLLRLYNKRGEEWMKQHYKHLKAPYTNFEKIVEEDQLQLEKHLDSWLYEDRFPVAFVKYESMWDHQNEISEFLGLEIELPSYRERKAQKKKDNSLLLKLQKTYDHLRKKIDNLDDFFIHKKVQFL